MSTSVLTFEKFEVTVTSNGKVLETEPKVARSDGVQAVASLPNGKGTSLEVLPTEFYTRFFSDLAKRRKTSAIRRLLPLEANPGMLSLLAGKPNPTTFPITSLSFTARSPIDNGSKIALNIDGEDLTEALQYGATAGLPRLLNWLYKLQEISHGRKNHEGWSISVGSGSQDLIHKAVIALVNQGDSVLLESPLYAGVIPLFQNLKCDQIEVETDAHGISASALRSILENWPTGKPKPKVLYTVPYGCNPTGMTATLERRKEVLRLAREHDFLILEDDPYFYLYYGESPRYPSYFSLEAQEPHVGRVLRFDSFSKILSAGMRIGFITGPKPLVDAIDKHTGTANLEPSSLTQFIVFKLLESWGYDGFNAHVVGIAEFYRKKRDVFERAMRTHLEGLAEWITPEAGMFFWFKLLLSNNSNAEDDSEAVIREKAVEYGVLALPGIAFLPNERKSAYVRASFSVTDEEDVEEAIKRIRRVILDARESS